VSLSDTTFDGKSGYDAERARPLSLHTHVEDYTSNPLAKPQDNNDEDW
jgi:hypothetical protein